jgi:hypothetical protein
LWVDFAGTADDIPLPEGRFPNRPNTISLMFYGGWETAAPLASFARITARAGVAPVQEIGVVAGVPACRRARWLQRPISHGGTNEPAKLTIPGSSVLPPGFQSLSTPMRRVVAQQRSSSR